MSITHSQGHGCLGRRPLPTDRSPLQQESASVVNEAPAPLGNARYRNRAMLPLLQCIAEAGDREALHEWLINRRPCRWGKEWVSLKDFIHLLWERFSGGADRLVNAEVADRALDLTIDKFCNLPIDEQDERGHESEVASAAVPVGPNCRLYYQAYLKWAENSLPSGLNAIEAEALAARGVQRFVEHHFQLSLAEARRQCNVWIHRYYWHVQGHSICLYMPRRMTGQEKRVWLEANIESVYLDSPGERQRIQTIVDMRLNLSFVGEAYTDVDHLADPEGALSWAVEYEVTTSGLARAVANEKADHICELRPSIRELGSERLRQLVLEVFSDLVEGGHLDSDLARRYGLSKASYSRFAGHRWAAGANGDASLEPPALWVNTAQVLGSCPTFVEAAQAAGVWDRVKAVVHAARNEGA